MGVSRAVRSEHLSAYRKSSVSDLEFGGSGKRAAQDQNGPKKRSLVATRRSRFGLVSHPGSLKANLEAQGYSRQCLFAETKRILRSPSNIVKIGDRERNMASMFRFSQQKCT